MGKQEFLARLEKGLTGLPQDEIAERLAFYGEMIDDRMEEGLSEEAAVAEIGSVDEIVSQAVADIPLPKLVRERVRTGRSLQAWEIVLLVLGFPLWFPLLAAVFAILLSVYIVIWSLILSLWAIDLSFAASALGVLAMGIVLICRGNVLQGTALIGACLVLAGLSILMFYVSLAATKGAAAVTKKIALGIKSLFVRKENTK